MKRVVVTGMAGITSLGETADAIFEQFAQAKSGIRYMPDWENILICAPSWVGLSKALRFPNILIAKSHAEWAE
jgi:3-oxoacyl-(acyl-carrier-protein) synthase